MFAGAVSVVPSIAAAGATVAGGTVVAPGRVVSPGIVVTVGWSASTCPLSALASSGRFCDPRRHADVGVRRDERDREHHGVLVDGDVVEVGDVGGAVVGVGEVVPHDHLQFGVLLLAVDRALRLVLFEDAVLLERGRQLRPLVLREDELVVVELDAVDVEEQRQLGPLPRPTPR